MQTQFFSGVLSQWLKAPVRPQTYRNLLYLLLMFPLGILYFNLLLIGFTTGIGLAVVIIGVPIILLVLVGVTGMATFERTLISVLLGIHISPSSEIDADGVWTRLTQLVADRRTWMAVVYLLSVFVFGSFVFGVLASLTATAWSFFSAPLYYQDSPVVAYSPIPQDKVTLEILFGWDTLLIGLTTTFQLGSWQIETLPGALLIAVLGLGLFFLVVLPLVNVLTLLWGRYARFMLVVPSYVNYSD